MRWLMFVVMGVGGCLAAAAGYLHPRIRHLEAELPDMMERMAAPAEVEARRCRCGRHLSASAVAPVVQQVSDGPLSWDC